MTSADASTTTPLDGIETLRKRVLQGIGAGERLAGMFATAPADGDPATATLSVALANPADVELHEAVVGQHYPSLTTKVPAAYWYERVIHDLFGVVPDGHPRLVPLVLPMPPEAAAPDAAVQGTRWPSPGRRAAPPRLVPDERAVPRHVHGPGLFTMPHGPVRSGVMESVEYLVETPGEDIPHLQVRVFAKHRGIERAFQGKTVEDGALLAERVEGVSSVAHALAYAHAVERLAGVSAPPAAADVRVLHAELERVANHLDSAVKLTDGAGLAVAVARFGWHKERVLRVRSRLCGNRFGRGVVVPGGVSHLPTSVDELATELGRVAHDIAADARLLMRTPSFLDRIRGTGPLPALTAVTHGALGPVARGSGYHDDARRVRPYDGYGELSLLPPQADDAGDAQARTRVRWHEIAESFHLIDQVLERLPASAAPAELRVRVPECSGRGIGWAEAAQGEVLYVVALEAGRITRCWPRSASFHNLSLFHDVFAGDVLTDFAFIEASFGLSIAGVVM